jgi:hypothetical protein
MWPSATRFRDRYLERSQGAVVSARSKKHAEPVAAANEDQEMPPDVFEALVAGWTEILVADYIKRHPERTDLAPA